MWCSERIIVVAVLLSLLATGCGEPDQAAEAPNTSADSRVESNEEPESGHEHSVDDVLVWVQTEIADGDYTLSLGHHGAHFHPGDSIEPAVQLKKDSEDFGDAKIHITLVSKDGETVLAEEQPAVYEPKTDSEPAHYAQAKLAIPEDAEDFLIRFRIGFPELETESAYDIECSVSHD